MRQPADDPSRRWFLGVGLQLLVPGLLGGCGLPAGQDPEQNRGAALSARVPPADAVGRRPPAGRRHLGLEGTRDAVLYVPPGVRGGQRLPLLVTLHGAGRGAPRGLAPLLPFADAYGLVLLSPASRDQTWDGVLGGFGPDVDVIDRALRRVFRRVPIDPERIGIAGFSDGASYALGLGLANGDLFRRIVAFSPGFVPAARRVGRPAVFISHGQNDDILPIRSTSRTIVPALRRDGYDVTYREFPGRHSVPRPVARAAVDWLDWAER
jgi:phospholipase/carboxylesterase